MPYTLLPEALFPVMVLPEPYEIWMPQELCEAVLPETVLPELEFRVKPQSPFSEAMFPARILPSLEFYERSGDIHAKVRNFSSAADAYSSGSQLAFDPQKKMELAGKTISC